MSRPEQIVTEGSNALTVQTVTDFNALRSAGRAWESLYQRDPEATMFLSPNWLAPILAERAKEWVAIGVFEGDSKLMGFLPLWRRAYRHRDTGHKHVEYESAGRLVWSNYTGILCDPDHEPEVIDTIATTVSQMDWTLLMLPYMPHTERSRRFAAGLGPDAAVRFPPMHSKGGRVNSHKNPRLKLYGDYDTYLETALAPDARSKVDEARRTWVQSGRVRIEDATIDDQFKPALDTAMAIWRKNTNAAEATFNRTKAHIVDLNRRGLLTMPCLYKDDQVIGALINIIDTREAYELSKMTILDTNFSDVPGRVLLHSEAIRAALQRGRATYDLGQGDEPWKYALGAEDLGTHTLVATRRRLRSG